MKKDKANLLNTVVFLNQGSHILLFTLFTYPISPHIDQSPVNKWMNKK